MKSLAINAIFFNISLWSFLRLWAIKCGVSYLMISKKANKYGAYMFTDQFLHSNILALLGSSYQFTNRQTLNLVVKCILYLF